MITFEATSLACQNAIIDFLLPIIIIMPLSRSVETISDLGGKFARFNAVLQKSRKIVQI